MINLTRALGYAMLLLAFVDTATCSADSVSVRLGNTTFTNGAVESQDLGNTRFYPDGSTDNYIGGSKFHYDAPEPRIRPPTDDSDGIYEETVRQLWSE